MRNSENERLLQDIYLSKLAATDTLNEDEAAYKSNLEALKVVGDQVLKNDQLEYQKQKDAQDFEYQKQKDEAEKIQKRKDRLIDVGISFLGLLVKAAMLVLFLGVEVGGDILTSKAVNTTSGFIRLLKK